MAFENENEKVQKVRAEAELGQPLPAGQPSTVLTAAQFMDVDFVAADEVEM